MWERRENRSLVHPLKFMATEKMYSENFFKNIYSLQGYFRDYKKIRQIRE